MSPPEPSPIACCTESRVLHSDTHSALASLFIEGLVNTALLQVLRLPVAKQSAFSVFALYREAGMNFEASARLKVTSYRLDPESVLAELLGDPCALDRLLGPWVAQVGLHFQRVAPERHSNTE